ncbi:DUF6183 family protein [Streptomyces sp. NPDC002690]
MDDDRIRKIVTELPGLTDVNDVRETADRVLAQGNPAFLADLGIALVRAYGSGGEPGWQYRSVFGHLLRSLALTPGPGNVAQALRLARAAHATDRSVSRRTASLLASCRPAEELTVAFTGEATEDLRACLVHELVLRGVAVMELPAVAAWAGSPHWRLHPLRWLPWTLSDVEGRPELPSYSLHGGSHSLPFGSASGTGVTAGPGPVPRAEETTTEALAGRIGAAVANWTEESNGRAEARVFALAGPLDARSVPAVLRSVGLECLRGEERARKGTKARKKAKATSSFSVEACGPDWVWEVLFAAASTGGAYNYGVGGAYGRLAAWQSLSALAGAAEGSTAEEAEARVRACSWYSFGPATDWFADVAWDIGLVALSPDGERLAVLAATDTD